ncbi:MAG: tRNA (adenosine(37)-N6)-dimethylallyltransferase MiaA [Victivallaceae bacterium]|nr:tRNA (adenosine(37)-N6)-dimethylallyltransferase MiaA [Victivallaceae bacterium]
MKIRSIAITGPTATGKTRLAVEIAREIGGEIISVDSRQLYRGLDLGTGKDLEEYGPIPCHLVDVAEPGEVWHLAAFVRAARRAAVEIAARGHVPVLCGGSILYLAALLQNYELPGGEPDWEARKELDAMPVEVLRAGIVAARPEFAERVREESNHNRLRRLWEIAHDPGEAAQAQEPPVEFDALVLGVYYPREEVRRRIEERLDARFAAGMVEEVRKLLQHPGVSEQWLDNLGLEYRQICNYVTGRCGFDQMRLELLQKIRQFAKRQDIFLRKLERENLPIHWCRAGRDPDPAELARAFLSGKEVPPPEFTLCSITNDPKASFAKPGVASR